jgi:hypothetical protein
MLLKGYVCSFCTVFNLLDANGESLQTPDSMAEKGFDGVTPFRWRVRSLGLVVVSYAIFRS